MDIVKFINENLHEDNIDRKMVEFSENSQFCYNKQSHFYQPEIIIVKNENGKMLFNHLMNLLSDKGGYKEKGIECIEDNIQYPYYVLSMDEISCGMRWGLWLHYGNDYSALSKEILIEEMTNDFDNFAIDIRNLFKDR